MGYCLSAYADYYAKKGETEQALEIYNKVLEIGVGSEFLGLKATNLTNIGAYLKGDKASSERITYFKDALKIYEKAGNLSGIATCKGALGHVYSNKGELKLGLSYFVEANKIFQELGRTKETKLTFTEIGKIYQKMGENKQALKYYNQALKIPTIKDDPPIYMGIGQILFNLDNFSQGYMHFKEALRIDEKNGDLSTKAEHLNLMGQSMKDKGHFKNNSGPGP